MRVNKGQRGSTGVNESRRNRERELKGVEGSSGEWKRVGRGDRSEE